MLWVYAIVFFLAFGASLASVPLARWLSYRLGAVSVPGGRRLETEPMPKLGGLAIFVGFIVAVIAAQYLPVPRQDPKEIVRLTGLLIGSSFVFLVWLLDDIFEFNWLSQAIAQVIAGGVSIFFLIFIEFFNNPLTGQQTDVWPFAVTLALTFFWYGMMMNTMNFLDGLDGLATGVAVIAGLMLFINSAFKVVPAQSSVALLPLAMSGACLGFLMYNFFPARIYLGGGAPLLGYWLASLSIIGGAKMATILLVLGLPLMDAAWQAFSRMLRGKNPMSGDRGHLHFRLLDRKILSHRQIVLLYYFFCAFFGILTLVLESQLYKFIAFGVMLGLISLGFFILLRLPNQSSSESI
jgi:UDP-GlcNAc:undecaprenyl-phosphate GlcNAc-1-phosphate transferase